MGQSLSQFHIILKQIKKHRFDAMVLCLSHDKDKEESQDTIDYLVKLGIAENRILTISAHHNREVFTKRNLIQLLECFLKSIREKSCGVIHISVFGVPISATCGEHLVPLDYTEQGYVTYTDIQSCMFRLKLNSRLCLFFDCPHDGVVIQFPWDWRLDNWEFEPAYKVSPNHGKVLCFSKCKDEKCSNGSVFYFSQNLNELNPYLPLKEYLSLLTIDKSKCMPKLGCRINASHRISMEVSLRKFICSRRIKTC